MDYIFLDEIDSTNRYLLEGSFPDGTIAITFNQTAGHGRSGRVWQGAAGQAMALSMQLKGVVREKLMGAQIVAGYAMVEALSSYCDARLKWPNDLVHAGKKLGGLIIETKFSGDTLEKAVFGVGVNINPPQELEIRGRAVSISELYDGKIEQNELATKCADVLQEWFEEYVSVGVDIVGQWAAYSANYMKPVKFHLQGVVSEVTELGVDDNGQLIMRDSSGVERIIGEGEIGYDFSGKSGVNL
ncbi:biotin--[acetyl-CoA-carboxylase] ligase [Deferribacterales bacterium RsTz2092]|nr:biotin--[acetyl-CoA-carboxylase] ligase [Deferribacterales bacterium]